MAYDAIKKYIWDCEKDSEDGLRTLVKNIRKKTCKDLIKNISQIGYGLNI